MDFNAAQEAVYQQLQALDQRLQYHDIKHTFSHVVPWTERLAREEQLTDSEIILVKTAALYHDVGFLDQYHKNEPLGCLRARKDLPLFGYSSFDIDVVCECIMATQMPQQPKNHLQQILCDADLCNLGLDEFFDISKNLRHEHLVIEGVSYSDQEWYQRNLDFVLKHQYFTVSANLLLGPKKKENISKIRSLLAE